MKRRATKIVLFLLLGAILNVAVAWVCALRPPPPVRGLVAWRGFKTEHDAKGWELVLSHRLGATRLMAYPQAPRLTFPPYKDVPTIYPWWSDWPSQLDQLNGMELPGPIMVEAAGWPTSALRSQWRDSALGDSVGNEGWSDGIGLTPINAVDAWGNTYPLSRALPLRPIFPGFAINTILYAAVLWASFVTIGVVRRRRRIKRGLCVKCGYDLRGGNHAACPECGKTVKP